MNEQSSSVIDGMCGKDAETTQEIFNEWLSYDIVKQKRSRGGWEPSWGYDMVFNGTFQQGDCGETMCSRNCAEISSNYLNHLSSSYYFTLLRQQDRNRIFRGRCNVGDECCQWCDGFLSTNRAESKGSDGLDDDLKKNQSTDTDQCEICSCSADCHEVIVDPQGYLYLLWLNRKK